MPGPRKNLLLTLLSVGLLAGPIPLRAGEITIHRTISVAFGVAIPSAPSFFELTDSALQINVLSLHTTHAPAASAASFNTLGAQTRFTSPNTETIPSTITGLLNVSGGADLVLSFSPSASALMQNATGAPDASIYFISHAVVPVGLLSSNGYTHATHSPALNGVADAPEPRLALLIACALLCLCLARRCLISRSR